MLKRLIQSLGAIFFSVPAAIHRTPSMEPPDAAPALARYFSTDEGMKFVSFELLEVTEGLEERKNSRVKF